MTRHVWCPIYLGRKMDIEDEIATKLAEEKEARSALENNQKWLDQQQAALRSEMQRQLDEIKAKFAEQLEENRTKVKERAVIHRTKINKAKVEVEQLTRVATRIKNERRLTPVDEQLWLSVARPHQIDGSYDAAISGRAILADRMGTGKTLTLLGTVERLGSKRTLVVAPKPLVENWKHEIRKWDISKQIIDLTSEKATNIFTLSMLSLKDNLIVVVNYEMFRNDTSTIEAIANAHFDTIILDESTAIKEVTSLTHRSLMTIIKARTYCEKCNTHYGCKIKSTTNDLGRVINYKAYANKEICCETETVSTVLYRYAATGTPIINKPEELFAQLHFMDPFTWPLLSGFLKTYCLMSMNTGKYYFNKFAHDKLKKDMGSTYICRDIEMNIPEQTVHEVNLTLSKKGYPKQYALIQDIQHSSSILCDDGESIDMTSILAAITRERQGLVAPWSIKVPLLRDGDIVKDENNRPVYREVGDTCRESIVIDWAYDLIRKLLHEGKRVVVISSFNASLDRMEELFKDTSTVLMNGKTSALVRDQIMVDFDRSRTPVEESKWKILFANSGVAAVGLNLTGAVAMVYLDSAWSQKTIDQTNARIARFGQTETTDVYLPVVPGTISERIQEILSAKADITDVIDSMAQSIRLLNGPKLE